MNPILFTIVVALMVVFAAPILFAALTVLVEIIRAIISNAFVLIIAAMTVLFIFALLARTQGWL